MGFDSFSLFAANTIIAVVVALAFASAWAGRREPYWKSWFFGNAILAAALIVFMYEQTLPDVLAITAANTLLLVGLGFRWRAAREFAGRPAPAIVVLGPAGVFLVTCAVPAVYASYGAVFTVVNLLLSAQAAAIAAEFWRDRKDGLPSRYGLVVTYMLLAGSFLVRAGQGIVLGHTFPRHLPDDPLLEIHLLLAVFALAASGAFALSIAYERGAAELLRMAHHDDLTGIANRRAFEERLRGELDAHRTPFAVVLLDIDHFKTINDRFGHAAGDAALRACARTCRTVLRNNDFIARIGGEEFALILPDVDSEKAYEISDRVRRAVGGTSIDWQGHRFRLTLSAGIYHSSAGDLDFDSIMRMADEQLYLAKDHGRDRVERSVA